MNISILFATSSSFTLPIIESIHRVAKGEQEMLDVYHKQARNNAINAVDLDETFEIDLTVLTYPVRTLRGKPTKHPIVEYCKEHSIPFIATDSMAEAMETLGSIDIGIVASFGKLLKKDVLEWPTYGWINWHPSQLPAYRGASPLQQTLLDGIEQTALTWIKMGEGMDDGDIWLQTPYSVNSNETFTELSQAMGQLGAHTWSIPFIHTMYKSNNLQPVEQQGTPTFVSKIRKDQKFISHKDLSAETIYNHWRAFIEFPGTVVDTKEFGEIKLNHIENTPIEIHDIEITYDSKDFIQGIFKHKTYVFLKCRDSLLNIHKITNKQGRLIDMSGYIFKS